MAMVLLVVSRLPGSCGRRLRGRRHDVFPKVDRDEKYFVAYSRRERPKTPNADVGDSSWQS